MTVRVNYGYFRPERSIRIFISISGIFPILQPDVTETFEHAHLLLILYVTLLCIPGCIPKDLGIQK